MSSEEVLHFMQHLAAPAEVPRAQSFDTPLGPEMTVEQYDALVAGMKANAAQHGLRKPHG